MNLMPNELVAKLVWDELCLRWGCAIDDMAPPEGPAEAAIEARLEIALELEREADLEDEPIFVAKCSNCGELIGWRGTDAPICNDCGLPEDTYGNLLRRVASEIRAAALASLDDEE
jgi:hypothetical protein